MSRGLVFRWAGAPCMGWMLAVLSVAFAASAAVAAAPSQATSSRAAREDAIKSIPFSKLDTGAQAKVKSVISHTSIYRRLPVQMTDCDPDMYLFLVRHPDVIVNIWEVMGISKCTLARSGKEGFKAADGAGSSGTIKYLYSSHDTHVIYAEGSYEGPLFERPVRARCVLVLKSGYVQEANGRKYVTSRMDAFIHIEHLGIELLAKTFQSLVTQSADYNFTETAAFMGNVSRTAESNSAGMGRLAAKLKHVAPEDSQKLADLANNVAEKKTAQKPPVRTAAGGKKR